MDNETRNRWAIGLGFLAGGAIGYFLASDKGRELRKETNEKLNDFTTEANRIAQDQLSNFSDSVNNIVTTGKTYVESSREWANRVAANAKEEYQNIAEEANEKLSEAEASFKDGITKARKKIKSKTEKIESTNKN